MTITCLISLWSLPFTASKLYRSIFFDREYIDGTDFIHRFEYAISSHTNAFDDNMERFETQFTSTVKNLFCKYFASIRSAFLCSFEAKQSTPSTKDLIALQICQSHKSIAPCCLDMQNPRIKFNIFFLLHSCSDTCHDDDLMLKL